MRSYLLIAILFCCIGCKKSNEELNYQTINSFAPAKVGATYFYRLDSTIAPAFGAGLINRSYQCKDSIESSFVNSVGNTTLRVFRYLRDTLGTQAWQYKSTYSISFTNNGLELSENNLRYLKLVNPIIDEKAWKGNSYIDTKSINSAFRYLDDWDYTYTKINEPYTVKKGKIDSTITVLQKDETIPAGPFNPNSYQQKNYSIEVYAKGIGLIYEDFLHYTYQTSPTNGYEEGTYGIRLSLIDYKQ